MKGSRRRALRIAAGLLRRQRRLFPSGADAVLRARLSPDLKLGPGAGSCCGDSPDGLDPRRRASVDMDRLGIAARFKVNEMKPVLREAAVDRLPVGERTDHSLRSERIPVGPVSHGEFRGRLSSLAARGPRNDDRRPGIGSARVAGLNHGRRKPETAFTRVPVEVRQTPALAHTLEGARLMRWTSRGCSR